MIQIPTPAGKKIIFLTNSHLFYVYILNINIVFPYLNFYHTNNHINAAYYYILTSATVKCLLSEK